MANHLDEQFSCIIYLGLRNEEHKSGYGQTFRFNQSR